MSDGFFGGFFDFDGDGSLDPGEMAFMGVLGASILDDEEESARKSKRSENAWDDEDYDSDDDDDDYDSDFEDINGVRKVDASDSYEVMKAVRSPVYDWDDIEWLVDKALDLGTKFDEDEVEEICNRIYDHDLKDRLILGQ